MQEEHVEHSAEESNGSATGTLSAPAHKPGATQRKPRMLPPFKVLLHNDEVSTFDHVIRSITQLTPLTSEEGVIRAIEAHETGVSLLLVTHRERAELYVDQFTSLQLTVTIEPDTP